MNRRVALFLLVGLSSCYLAKDEVSIVTRTGQQVAFHVEFARTQSEWAQGLMHRRELAPDRGMFFVFPEDQTVPFWMKDTFISLDILFISADKKVVFVVHEAKPLSEELLQADQPYRYVLEIPGGTVAKNGIEAGNSVKFSL